MMKYENLMNKQYKEPEDGKFEDATKEILEAVSGDSNIDYDKEIRYNMQRLRKVVNGLATNWYSV